MAAHHPAERDGPLSVGIGEGLDELGNWSGDAAGQASTLTFQDTDLDLVRDAGEAFVRSAHQATNEANEIVEYFSSNGTQSTTTTGFAYDGSGSLVFDGGHFYVYDAWNRLTEVRGPGDLMVDTDGVLVGTPGLPQERFRYDALGRKVVSEVLTGEPAGVTRHVYGTGAAVLAEYDVTTDGVGGDQETLTRWFVHGEGFPEPLVLVDVTDAGVESAGTPEVLYYLTDALGSVGMLADAAGAAVELYMYTPYGPTTIAGPVYGNPLTTSLFGNPLAWTGQRYSPTTALYHFWARSYSPLLGRFLQEDMQGALAAVDISLGGEGQSASISGPSAAADGEYVDGLNLFLYASSDPINSWDPFGLDDWDDEIDSVTADLTGQKLYAIGAINEGAKWAAYSLNFALDLASSLLPGSGLYDAFQSVQVIANGGGGFWDAMNIATAAFPVAKMAGKALGMRSLFKARGYAKRACNCFAAGTEVDTPEGAVAVEALRPGDEVLTRPPDAPGDCPRPARVTRVFRDLAPVILWLTLANGQVMGVTPDHEVWSHDDGWTSARCLVVGDTFADADGQPVAVQEIRVDRTPTPVYNLEVEGDHTYFAAGVWVHNNSCHLWSQGRWNKLVGDAYEAWVLPMFKFSKNKTTITAKGRSAVPDFMERGIIGDVKNVERLKWDDQLIAIKDYAQQNGLEARLIVSESLIQHIDEGISDVFKIVWGP